MSPLDRLAACAGKMLAQIEMYFPGFDDDALEETPLVDTEVHEPSPRPPPLVGAAWNRPNEKTRTAATLGIDERDAVWKSVVGTLWRWDNGRWWHSYEDQWEPAPYDFWPQDTGPFIAVRPQTVAMDWHGWAVPAILECLAQWPALETEYDTYEEWCEGIAPKIADRIACDPRRAIEALSHYKPDRVFP